MATFTYDDIQRHTSLLRLVATGTYTVDTPVQYGEVLPLIKLCYVSIYCDERGKVRLRLKKAGETRLSEAP